MTLARESSLLSAALESTADGLLVVDLEGKITRYNRRFLVMWQLGSDAVRSGRDESALLVAAEQLEDPDGFTSRVRERYYEKDSEGLDVLRLKDGRVFERYTQPQRLDGRIIGRVWSFRDVTEREQQLSRATFLSEASYLLGSLDVESALAGVADLAIRSFADACAVDLLSGGTGPRRLRSATRTGVAAVPTRLSQPVLDGNAIIQSTARGSRMVTPLVSHGTLVGLISFARRRAYSRADLASAEELARRACLAIDNAQLYRTAKDALLARDEFLAVAAHEIRGPLTVLRLAAQQLARTPGMPEEASRPLSLIAQQNGRLSRFVDELIEATALRVGRPNLSLSEVDLGEVVRDALTQLGPELASAKSAISMDIEGQIVGLWDKAKVAQVVTKLLSNAIKFGLGKPIHLSASGHDGVATIAIADHGIGIPSDRLTSIFDPFDRAVSARHYGGLGLGLYVVRELVTAMGGTVSVTSSVNEGSTFTVTLPQARTP